MNKTGIEWTELTWNPLRGCSRVSEGCRHCYAERMAARFSGDIDLGNGRSMANVCRKPMPFDNVAIMTGSGPRWTGRVELIGSKLTEPLRKRKPATIFVNSMSDTFHEEVSDAWLDRMFAVMALCPQHEFLVLTKRARRMREYVAGCTVEGKLRGDLGKSVQDICNRTYDGHVFEALYKLQIAFKCWPWPLPNVALGVSCEDQQRADERIPDLLATPAACRMVSLEPLLGLVDLKQWLDQECPYVSSEDMRQHWYETHARINWLICGGESGSRARPMHPNWVRSIRDQCVSAGLPFFFKQWGHFRPVSSVDTDDCIEAAVQTANIRRTVLVYRDGRIEDGDRLPTEPGGWFMEPVGKKSAGRLLDGKVWDQRPEG